MYTDQKFIISRITSATFVVAEIGGKTRMLPSCDSLMIAQFIDCGKAEDKMSATISNYYSKNNSVCASGLRAGFHRNVALFVYALERRCGLDSQICLLLLRRQYHACAIMSL